MFSPSNVRRSTLTAAGVALAVALALTGCGATSTSGNSAAGSSAGSSTEAATPGLNVPVTVGAFEFTALAAADAGATVGASPLEQTAQGSYFRLDLKIANVGDGPETFIVNYVTLEDADGKTYDADALATLYAGGDSQAWVAAINPGNAVEGPLLFDLPAGTQPVKLLVRDSILSDGTPIVIG